MGASFTVVPAGFALGAMLLQGCAALPGRKLTAAALVLSLTLFGFAAVVARSARRRVAVTALLAFVAALLAGFGYATLRSERRLADALPSVWENRDLRVRGVVDGLPQSSVDGTRFAFAVEEALTPGATVPRRLSLAWFAPDPGARGSVPGAGAERALPVVHAGERWTLTLRLKRPHGTVNPHGFDLEGWLFERNLRATGHVRSTPPPLRNAAFAGRASDHIERARESIRTRIAVVLGESASAGVVAALAIGDQGAIPSARWQVFNRTGVTHLISISGLHVTVFAALAGFVTLVVARRSTVLTSRIPARKLALATGVFAAWGYVLLAGAEVPAVRTLVMLAVAAAGSWLDRPGSALAVWLWSLAAVSLADPWASLSAGFWLSFGAVGLLLYACGTGTYGINGQGASTPARLWRLLVGAVRVQWVVTVGLVPGTLAWFQQVSLVSLAANAVAIPVVTFAVVPLALAGIALPFALPWQFAGALLERLLRWLDWLSAWPGAIWSSHAPMPWTLAAATIGVAWIFAPRGIPGRPLGVTLMLPMVLVAPAAPLDGSVRAVVLDVGQGLAVAVTTARHALLYDAGPRHRAGDAGARVVVPYLRSAGIGRLDLAIVSHADSDHSGGIASVLAAVPVASVLSSTEAATVARLLRTPGTPSAAPLSTPLSAPESAVSPPVSWRRCEAGETWEWDGVRFEIVHPHAGAYLDEPRKSNDLSCVLAITSSAGRLLVAGDIEARAENEMLARQATPLRADVLVVPHHGSQTSSTPAFIAAVAPRFAAIAAGYLNRFGHPRPVVLERYARAGIAIARTDVGGAVAFDFIPGRELLAVVERQRRRRYWYDRRRRARRAQSTKRPMRTAVSPRRGRREGITSTQFA